jgi:DNA repair protein RecN (Recombination protein N)
MLQELFIQNYALIKKMKIDFSSSLNVFTGETGAGKSILIDALRLALGDRLPTIKGQMQATDKSILQASFSMPTTPRFFPEQVYEFLDLEDELLILRREINADGKSKCSINGQTVNLSMLRDVGVCLIDFHGQYDHQTIFSEATHLELLNRLAGLDQRPAENYLVSYQAAFAEWKRLEKQKANIISSKDTRERELDLLNYQLEELGRFPLEDCDEEELTIERIRLSHTQKISDIIEKLISVLDEDDNSAGEQIAKAFRELQQWVRIDESIAGRENELEEIQLKLEEFLAKVRDYRDELSSDDNRLSELQDQLDQISVLKRKYGPTMKDVILFYENAKQKQDQLLNADVYFNDIDKEIKKVLPDLKKNAEAMTALRKKAALDLQAKVEGELKDLGMLHAKFSCQITKTDWNINGQEEVRFLFSPNPGFELMPVAKIASGGEASRVILALKRALMDVDSTPTLIFDEIDANIGGRLGDVVGRKLREIADKRQVLLITHLPQIASFGQKHFKVVKVSDKASTVVDYQELNADERVKELSQMMSGTKESKISKSHAEEMLKTASQ